MTQITEGFVERQVEELKERENVKAIALVGSYARNPEGEQNDLDIYIVIDGEWRKRITEIVDGVVVEKFYNSLKFSKDYLEDEEWWRNYRWFVNADVRYDEGDFFQELEEKAEEVRKEKMDLSEQDLKAISYSIWDIRQDVNSKDVSQKRFMMNQLFNYLLEKQYLLKGEVPVKENHRLEKLQEFDGYMYKLSQDFMLSSSTMEKEKKLEKIIEHVSKNLPDIGPEWESEREEF